MLPLVQSSQNSSSSSQTQPALNPSPTPQPTTTPTAGPIPSPIPGAGISLPNNIWVNVHPSGLPIQTLSWDQLVYSPAIKKSIYFGSYHEYGSEMQRAIAAYDFDTNRWDLLDLGGTNHSENMPEGGHPTGMMTYSHNRNLVILGTCCESGSMESESVNHTWWFDPIGMVGRDKYTYPNIGQPLQGVSAFDSFNDKYMTHFEGVVGLSPATLGTFQYNPVANNWLYSSGTETRVGGQFPSLFDYLDFSPISYDSDNHLIYMFGGRTGYLLPIFYNDIYTYNTVTNTWTMLNPSGTKPPGRIKSGFAYDTLNHVFLLYGGEGALSGLNDTWIFDPNVNSGQGSWTQMNPANSPPNIKANGVDPIIPFFTTTYDSDHNVFVTALADVPTGYNTAVWLYRYQGAGSNPGTAIANYVAPTGGLNRKIDGWASQPSLFTNGTDIYATWEENGSPNDNTDCTWSHIMANKWSGGSWSNLGANCFSINSEYSGSAESFEPAIAFAGGVPWVSYEVFNNSGVYWPLYARYWNGSTWIGGPVGAVGRTGTSYLGDWSATNTYNANEVVTACGYSYVAQRTNSNTAPSCTGASNAAWRFTSGYSGHSQIMATKNKDYEQKAREILINEDA